MMVIYIFTNNAGTIKKAFPKTAEFLPLKLLSEHKPENESVSYIDVSMLKGANLNKALTLLKKRVKNESWGVIDPKGNVKDAAALFFDGASDYLGSGFLKSFKSIAPARVKNAVQWRKKQAKVSSGGNKESGSPEAAREIKFFKSNIKLPPANSFLGWKKTTTGRALPFYLLYCSLYGKHSLYDQSDDKTAIQIHRRFLETLEENFLDGDGLLWMDSGKECLFLVPPRIKSIEKIVKSCFGMLVSAPLITLEKLNAKAPLNFIFSLHYGLVNYKPPGKTGTVVSDAVNNIFHLGAKKAQSGRLTVTDKLPDSSIPKSLIDCFFPAGEFEGNKIWHSRKFSYVKPWV